MSFDADAAGVHNGAYFGLDTTLCGSALALLSVAWDATVSYRDGASRAPKAIIDASVQVEIYDADFVDVWQNGICTLPFNDDIARRNKRARRDALRVISHIERGGNERDAKVARYVKRVNEASEWLNDYVYNESKRHLDVGRKVGLVGGDHSTPLGLIRAVAERHPGVGILHIDAHMDLRDGYEGFHYSHASIMRRALECEGVGRLVQVGVRDFSRGEVDFAHEQSRVVQFSDRALSRAMSSGQSWASQCACIVENLPSEVYISFDIDGLQRAYCPSTGTPVPGGLTYNEAVELLLCVNDSGRKVVGFDLNEVAPSPHDEWDAIVGARLLYKLSNLTIA